MVASQRRGIQVARIVATYLAWLATAALGLGVLIAWHSALLRLYANLDMSEYGLAFFNNTVVIILALLWLVGLIVLETWFRRAGDFPELGRRVGRTLFAEVALALLAWVIGRL